MMKKKITVKLRKLAEGIQLAVEGKKPAPVSDTDKALYLLVAARVTEKLNTFKKQTAGRSRHCAGGRLIYQVLKELHKQGLVKV